MERGIDGLILEESRGNNTLVLYGHKAEGPGERRKAYYGIMDGRRWTCPRFVFQALSFPLAAYASARHDRARIVAVGAFLWAAATFLVAISRTYLQVLFQFHFCPPNGGSPIFAEIVPAKARTTVYALDKCFESVFASFAPPVVGILAERVFGYKPVSSESSVDMDRENAAALAKAMYVELAVPMAICSLTYALLYCTYPRDRDTVNLMASEEDDGSESSAFRAHQDEESSPVGSLTQRLIPTTTTD
ncbi:hypothetical protein TRIUR3_25920 [Triticum urartu]|uniref:Uncharacterized protein n=1 Tax=Triticum urartu TaxID=4572 RepID=M7ZTJ1_TRIUA|nr:hypothetical protein TRIUR3_25920 [Triticum urartu]